MTLWYPNLQEDYQSDASQSEKYSMSPHTSKLPVNGSTQYMTKTFVLTVVYMFVSIDPVPKLEAVL